MEHEIAAAIRNSSMHERGERLKTEIRKNAATNGRLIILILAAVNLFAGAAPILATLCVTPLALAYLADVFDLRGNIPLRDRFALAGIGTTASAAILTLFNAW